MRPLQELERAARRWPALVEDTKAPEVAQARVWERTARLLERAPFWSARTGGRMPALEELEVTTFADYADAVTASFDGPVSALNGEPVVFWAQSSGSSGPQKKFPWTPTFQEQYLEGADLPLPMFRAIARLRGRGPILSLVATNSDARSPAGIPCGYVSNYVSPDTNPVYPRAVDNDKEMFRRWMPLYALATDLGGLRAVSCDHVFLLLDRIEADRDFYLARLRDDEPLPAGLPRPKVSEARLAHVARVLSSSDSLQLDEIWPTLRLVHTWRSATAGLQAAQLARRASDRLRIVDLTYTASEGPVANPVDPDAVGGPIHPGSIVHEFFEAGAQPSRENVVKAWELQPGRSYEVLLTTAMGLVRYRIGDVVRCTGFYNRAPTLTYERRSTGELSLDVTTFSESELVSALGKLALVGRARRVFGPSDDGRALVLYTDDPLRLEQIEQMHQTLAEVNDTYRDFQSQGRVAKLAQAHLPAEHPVWAHCEPKHAQAKPVVLLNRPPSTFEG